MALCLKKSLQIKEDRIAALEARLGESFTLNQQLWQELKTVSCVIRLSFYRSVTLGREVTYFSPQVKLSYEALQQRQEEEWISSSSAPPREAGKAMSEWLRESQEATKELLKLKDRLIEVERNVSDRPLLSYGMINILLNYTSGCF